MMTSYGALADGPPEASLIAPMTSSTSTSNRPWRLAALLLAGAAQLITISAPVSADSIRVSRDVGVGAVEALARKARKEGVSR